MRRVFDVGSGNEGSTDPVMDQTVRRFERRTACPELCHDLSFLELMSFSAHLSQTTSLQSQVHGRFGVTDVYSERLQNLRHQRNWCR